MNEKEIAELESIKTLLEDYRLVIIASQFSGVVLHSSSLFKNTICLSKNTICLSKNTICLSIFFLFDFFQGERSADRQPQRSQRQRSFSRQFA